MAFNVISKKHRDDGEVLLNLIGPDGKPLMYYDITKEEKEAYEEKVRRFKAGELKREPKLDAEQKHVRIKMLSPYSEAFRRAKLQRKIKDQVTLQGVVSTAQAELSKGEDADINAILENNTNKLIESLDNGAKMICDLTVDWEGFIDDEQNRLEYNPETLFAALTDPDNMTTYTAIIRDVEDKQAFFTA